MPTNESQYPPLSPRPVPDQGTNCYGMALASYINRT